MIYGYARVSTVEQNFDRQLKALESAGCEKIYMDKLSGKNTKRPQLQQLFEDLKEGDTIIVKDLTRFSRSTRDLFDLLDAIKEKGAFLKSVNDSYHECS
jgi:DNA invertase Pin-like site-specific DNA recombinase